MHCGNNRTDADLDFPHVFLSTMRPQIAVNRAGISLMISLSYRDRIRLSPLAPQLPNSLTSCNGKSPKPSLVNKVSVIPCAFCSITWSLVIRECEPKLTKDKTTTDLTFSLP